MSEVRVMKSNRKLISFILLSLFSVSNFVHAKSFDIACNSKVSLSDDDDDDDIKSFSASDSKKNTNLDNVILPLIIVGLIYRFLDVLSSESVQNILFNQETERKCLAEMTLKNGVKFSVFFGDILEWQGNQKEEGKKIIVGCPDNSNLHPNGGLAHKICRAIGGHIEKNGKDKDKDNWVYPDQSNLQKKLAASNNDKSDQLKVGSVIMGVGTGEFDVCHLVGPSVASSGAKLSDTQKQQLKNSYLNAIKKVASTDKMGVNLYSAINICTVSDALFNVSSADSAAALADVLLNVDALQFPAGVKYINLVIHSKFNDVSNDKDTNLKRTDVFINTIKSKFGNDENGNPRLIDMRN